MVSNEGLDVSVGSTGSSDANSILELTCEGISREIKFLNNIVIFELRKSTTDHKMLYIVAIDLKKREMTKGQENF